MKRIISTLLIMVMLISLMPSIAIPAFAEVTSGTTGDCTWTLNGTELTISGNGKMANYEYHGGEQPWPKDIITKVIIENGVTSIGACAFAFSHRLTSITIGNSVTAIGGLAFYDTAYKNEEANWENDVLYIGNYLIEAKTSISGSYSIKEGTCLIANNAFQGCTALTSVTIPDSVTSIGNSAFSGCSALTSVKIPDGVTSINPSTFSICSSLTSVTIPDSVTSIGNSAFFGCSALTSVKIPDNVTSFGEYAFYGCSALTSVKIPDGITSINPYTFYNCSGLTSVTIPDSVTSIGRLAFSGCSALTSVKIPDSVTNIGFAALSGCSNLTSITLPFLGAVLDDIDFPSISYLFDPSGFFQNDSVPSSLKTVVITRGNFIGNGVFSGCSGMTSVTIPDSVTSIGNSAFSGCSALTSVKIPDNVTSIGDSAFADCSALTSVKIPDNVTSIGEYAFSGCSALTSVKIPDGVTSINPFTFDNCSSLTSVTIPDSVTTIGYAAFLDCNNLTTVLYTGTQEQYQQIQIDYLNDPLTSATWYYDSCPKTGRKHVYSFICDVDCNECGAVRTPAAHKGGTATCKAKAVCTVCGASYGSLAAHKYTNACDKDCNECGSERTPAAHKGGTATCKEKAKCSVCGVAYGNLADHKFGGYVYNDDATSQKDGTKTRTCSVCKKTETITATDTKLKNPFKDVKLSQYYAEPVLWAVSKGITNGTSAATFSPDSNCTRGQIVTFLWRAAGSPEPTSTKNPFKDVKSNQYYYKAVLWAVEKGITTGTSANTFSPDAACTRGQVVTFLWRAKGKPDASGSNAFKDVKSGAYYYDAVRWAVKNSITNGMSATSFAPDATCTRGQIVTFLYRAYN